MVETIDEILADKLIAFVNCQPRIRSRDIWDLYWLKQKGSQLNLDLIRSKIGDYKLKKEDYIEKLSKMINRLEEIINPDSKFIEELKRFLPSDIQKQNLERPAFYPLLNSVIHEFLKEINDNLK